jgi:hypothetical protein
MQAQPDRGVRAALVARRQQCVALAQERERQRVANYQGCYRRAMRPERVTARKRAHGAALFRYWARTLGEFGVVAIAPLGLLIVTAPLLWVVRRVWRGFRPPQFGDSTPS